MWFGRNQILAPLPGRYAAYNNSYIWLDFHVVCLPRYGLSFTSERFGWRENDWGTRHVLWVMTCVFVEISIPCIYIIIFHFQKHIKYKNISLFIVYNLPSLIVPQLQHLVVGCLNTVAELCQTQIPFRGAVVRIFLFFVYIYKI